MMRASWRSSIQALGQSDTETSNAARATITLLRRAKTSCPADSTLTILKRNAPYSLILASEQTMNEESRAVPSMELRRRPELQPAAEQPQKPMVIGSSRCPLGKGL